MTERRAEPTFSQPFKTLSNGIRLGIVSALGEAMGGSEPTLTFSELQEAVDVDDNGKLSYHLREVVGSLVEKTEEGYRLRPAGMRVFQAVKSGAYDAAIEIPPREISDPCSLCDGSLSIWYEGGRVYSGCQTCDTVGVRYPLPPRMFDHDDPESLADAASKRLSRDYRSFLRGVCPYCSSDVVSELSADKPSMFSGEDSDARDVFGISTCTSCYWFLKYSLGGMLREHPAVISFYYERGLDTSEVRHWLRLSGTTVEVESDDPLTATVTFSKDGDARRLHIDEDLTVVAVEDVTAD